MHKDASIIALSWPDTLVVKEGKWYDVPMQLIGVLRKGRYKVGHAAMLLIHHNTGSVEYFDFGRYHTPLMHGRVRSAFTDPDVTVNTKMEVWNGKFENLGEVLAEVALKKATHGDGKMTAALMNNVCYQTAKNRILEMQDMEAIPYGPFELNGTNCSRFVAEIAKISNSHWVNRFFLSYPYTITPTPLSNMKVINSYGYYYVIDKGEVEVKINRLYFIKRMLCNSFQKKVMQLELKYIKR